MAGSGRDAGGDVDEAKASFEPLEGLPGATKWLRLLTEEEVERGACYRDGYSEDEVATLRRAYHRFIRLMAARLELSQIAVATATVYCHHFFVQFRCVFQFCVAKYELQCF